MSSDKNVIRLDQGGGVGTAPTGAARDNGGGAVTQTTVTVAHLSAAPKPAAAPALKLGRGLDVGTANVLSACQTRKDEVTVRRERNAFLEIPAERAGSHDLLTRLGVPYVNHKNRVYVLGDVSFELANMFGSEVRRPMQGGFLSPTEQDAIPIMRFLIDRLLGPPGAPEEPVTFSVPAPSIDQDNDTVYHEGIVSGVLKKLGFTPRPINEGHAVVYAELGDQDFTGIGISCGGGMFNVCVSYKSIPAVTFSVARGGDWIDEHVSKVMGIAKTRATAIKEGDVNLMQPRTREEEAVVLYYRNLIGYVLLNLKQRFALARDVPQFSDPVEIVVSGGTSLVGGFVEVFAEELMKVEFPLAVSTIRRAEDAITSVARGCLIAAALAGEQDA